METFPAPDRLDLMAPFTAKAIMAMKFEMCEVFEIDPEFSDTAAFCGHYGFDAGMVANCVIVKASRVEKTWFAVCLVLANCRADVNGLIRRHLGARKASFASMEEAVSFTGMEYGGITPVGLPADWPILIDKAVTSLDRVVVGSGIRRSKLILSGKALQSLPNATVLDGVGAAKIS